MPRTNSAVGNVTEVTDAVTSTSAARATADSPVTVRLDTGLVARLDTRDPRYGAWRSVLDDLRAAGLPVYVEVEPGSGLLTELLVPLLVTVEDIRDPGPDGAAVEIELRISHARHFLPRDDPLFDELLSLLSRAHTNGLPVLVTESPTTHEIIDVRLLPKAAPPAERRSAPEPPADVTTAAVTLGQAQAMFALVNGQTCCSAAPSAPGIPFTYPDDGCWARAHEMCRLMINAGAQPEKIWIYGALRVATGNHPACEVGWRWHVAPVLRVDDGAGPQVYVVDPALFPGPVSQATWTGVQGDPGAFTALSTADVFYRDASGVPTYDPTYADTNQTLVRYRGALQVRSASVDGPPPYPQCLTRPAGVQWFGTLEPGVSRRWFTFGWPAAWHVVWSVMPLTICAGAPQVSWTVGVERADADHVTYWITVRNLSPRTVRFEGRYDILSR